jgi:NAD(P)-dependent dehydrogenase (short-subunit alcohol dehydrogenase family)
VIGVVRTINAFLPLLKSGRAKKVITLASALGDLEFTLKTGLPSNAPYSVSKAAVNMVNVKYANELREDGFLFLALSPGFVDTSTGKRKFIWKCLLIFAVVQTTDCYLAY